ncbi:MAG: hypothetical protein HYV27_15290 [Candidatus Hydrogenedentes bacterium]|nr:hypothetical protein [Candidatus Hydrogenedentota bacterium]
MRENVILRRDMPVNDTVLPAGSLLGVIETADGVSWNLLVSAVSNDLARVEAEVSDPPASTDAPEQAPPPGPPASGGEEPVAPEVSDPPASIDAVASTQPPAE